MKKTIILSVIILLVSSCNRNESKTVKVVNELNWYLNEAVVQDAHKPPVASRIYAYPNIALYTILRLSDIENYPSIIEKSPLLSGINLPSPDDKVNLEFASVVAFVEIAKELVYRDFIMDSCYIALSQEFLFLNSKQIESSKQFGNKAATEFIKVLLSDGYNTTRSLPNYQVNTEASSWQPTPPKYLEACEPNWSKVTTFILDSSSMFLASPHTVFDTTSASSFFINAMEVYDISNNLTKDQMEIASFWDDNPSPMNIEGHYMKVKKQLSPPGHWLRIATQVSKSEGFTDLESAQLYATLCISMADAFKSAWHTKYHYDLIRPITFINNYIDKEWNSFLENPMFPEYTSAHSTISGAAVIIMNTLIGDEFAFTDSSQVRYGHTLRSFGSFNEMAEEVSISRVYGGIHYRESCDIGLDKGREIGLYVLEKLKD